MTIRATVCAALLLLTPSVARAVTFDDIIALSTSGVAAEILVAVIDADRTMFTLTPDEILVLRDAGVPDAVVVKMLGSTREFTEAPPPLIVGGAPAPGVAAAPAFAVPTFIAFPYFVPVGRAAAPPHGHVTAPRPAVTPAPPGFRRFINDGWIDGRGFGRFVNTP